MIFASYPKNALVIQLSGGLGNQLFEVVAGIYFADSKSLALQVDLSELGDARNSHGVTIRDLGFDLNFVDIKKEYSSVKYFFHRLAVFVQRKYPAVAKYLPYSSLVYSSPVIGFDPEAVARTRAVFMRGYYQSWRYLDEVKKRGLLPASNLASPTDWFIEHEILARKESHIAVHVRRGDFLAQGASWGILGPKYYFTALGILNEGQPKPIWVYSDDIQAAKVLFARYSNAPIRWMEPPAESLASESLVLMSMASDIVMANSTYSWWAASISHRTKRVVAPNSWFRGRREPLDLIPDSWIRIDPDWV